MATMRQDPRNTPPTAQTGNPSKVVGSGGEVLKKSADNQSEEQTDWLDRARSAYFESTTYVDTNYRKSCEDSIRAFNSQHSTSSKYSQPQYEKRSRIFRPRIRSVMRKNEAAAAAAFFSNMDVVTVTAEDQTSKAAVISAEIMKALLQYRLTKSIPWYQTVLGGLQDAQSVGVVIGHVYWDYQEEDEEEEEEEESLKTLGDAADLGGDPEYPEQIKAPEGALVATAEGHLGEPTEGGYPETEPASPQEKKPKVRVDKPCVDLLPVENFRISPAANWVNPVESSPFLIELKPMYILDVKEKMRKGIWFELSDDVISRATDLKTDSTRQSREKEREDPASQDSAIDDYQIVWVQRHIHRRDGQDWEFHMMGNEALLTEPILLSEVVLHGIRPYVMGCAILETHKIYPSSVPALAKGLIDEGNEITNQRLDNVKFVLNKKWFVKRGKEADIAGLVRNVPGGVVMLDDPEKDVKEVNWQDVTASAFQEQLGINQEMDDLVGNFSPAQIMQATAMNAPARNMSMLANAQGTLVEYLLRTYVETFIQPVLRHLVKLEQKYETDEVILAMAAKNSKLMQRYGTDQITDKLLEQELTLTVNVGMGATDPMQKLNKFLLGMGHYVRMLEKPKPGLNMMEIGKEIFGLLGYRDGSRFFTSDNPQVAVLQQQLQQAMQIINQLKSKKDERAQVAMVGFHKGREKNQADLHKVVIHESNENKRALATHWATLHKEAGSHAMTRWTKNQEALKPKGAGRGK